MKKLMVISVYFVAKLDFLKTSRLSFMNLLLPHEPIDFLKACNVNTSGNDIYVSVCSTRCVDSQRCSPQWGAQSKVDDWTITTGNTAAQSWIVLGNWWDEVGYANWWRGCKVCWSIIHFSFLMNAAWSFCITVVLKSLEWICSEDMWGVCSFWTSDLWQPEIPCRGRACADSETVKIKTLQTTWNL